MRILQLDLMAVLLLILASEGSGRYSVSIIFVHSNFRRLIDDGEMLLLYCCCFLACLCLLCLSLIYAPSMMSAAELLQNAPSNVNAKMTDFRLFFQTDVYPNNHRV